MLKKKKKNPANRGSTFWVISLLVIACLTAGWWFWRDMYVVSSPRLNFVLVSINQELRKFLSGETLALHPRDRVKIIKVSTNIPFNQHVRLEAKGFDVSSLTYEELSISDLLPGREIFDHYMFHILIKYRNQDLGYLDWSIRPYAEDWLEKANRTIDDDRRLAILETALRLLPEDREIKRKLLDEYKALKHWEQAAALIEEMTGENQDEDKLIELLEVYTAMQNSDGVISVLKKLVRLNPDDLDVRSQLAETLEAAEQLDEAISEYETLSKQMDKEDSLTIYKHLGYLHTKKGRFEKAIAYYLKAADLDQKDANLYYNLSYLYEKTNQQEKADFYLGNAVTLNSEDLENRLKLAYRLIDKKMLKKADKYLREVLAERPDSLEALVLMAQLLEQLGKKKELKKIYEKILSVDPKNETVIYNLGALEYGAGNLKASLNHFKKYIKSHPKDATVHGIIFDIYRKQKNTKMALKEALILVELRPKETDLYHYIFEHLNARGDYKKIISIMKKGLKFSPKETAFRECLVFAYLKTGKEPAAIGQMEKILKTRPRDTDLLFHLARLKEKHGDFKGALGAYKRIIEILPDNEEAEESYLRLRLKGVNGERKK